MVYESMVKHITLKVLAQHFVHDEDGNLFEAEVEDAEQCTLCLQDPLIRRFKCAEMGFQHDLYHALLLHHTPTIVAASQRGGFLAGLDNITAAADTVEQLDHELTLMAEVEVHTFLQQRRKLWQKSRSLPSSNYQKKLQFKKLQLEKFQFKKVQREILLDETLKRRLQQQQQWKKLKQQEALKRQQQLEQQQQEALRRRVQQRQQYEHQQQEALKRRHHQRQQQQRQQNQQGAHRAVQWELERRMRLTGVWRCHCINCLLM